MRTCPPRYGRAPCSSSTFLCPSSKPLRPEAPKGHTEGTCGNEGKEKAQQPLGIAELLSVEAAGIEAAVRSLRQAQAYRGARACRRASVWHHGAGVYSSALNRGLLAKSPPATSTSPDRSSVAVWALRGTDMFPAEDQLPVTGSYSCDSMISV